MRKSAIGLLLYISVSILGVANASFVIRLKNGNEYVTNRYWHERTQVLFDAEGGIFGVEKAFVKSIDETDKVIKLVSVAPQDPSERTQTEAAKETAGKDAAVQEPKKKERDADDPVIAEFNRLKGKSKEVDGMLATEIRDLLNQITAFKNKLLKDSKLFINYGREFNDLQELGSTVESALTSRIN